MNMVIHIINRTKGLKKVVQTSNFIKYNIDTYKVSSCDSKALIKKHVFDQYVTICIHQKNINITCWFPKDFVLEVLC